MRIHAMVTATILVGLASGATCTVVAQTPASLKRLEVSIWPEYDRPSALIIVNAQLADDAPLPSTVSLPLPSTATPHAVAKGTPEGRLLMADYTREERGGSSYVRIATDLRAVRLEYYTEISVVDAEREFIWIWPGGLDVGNLTYDVMPPPGATNLVIDPPPGARKTDGTGLTHLSADLGPRSASDRLAIRLTYTKSSPELTVAALQREQASPPQTPPPAEPTPTPTSPASPETSIWLFVLPVLAVGLIVAWMAFRRRSPR